MIKLSYKPDSVHVFLTINDYLSWTPITKRLMRATFDQVCLIKLALLLLQMGFATYTAHTGTRYVEFVKKFHC